MDVKGHLQGSKEETPHLTNIETGVYHVLLKLDCSIFAGLPMEKDSLLNRLCVIHLLYKCNYPLGGL